MNGNLFGTLSEAWRLAFGFLRDRQEASRTMREFGALDPREAGRVLADAGMDRADLSEAVSRPFAFEDLMQKGMQSIGIDPDDFAVRNPAWMRCLEHTCAMCRARGRCHRVMAHSEFAERYHEFCPNSEEFDDILAAKARAASPAGADRDAALVN